MNTQKNQKGFTLIELIVVVAIIGIIGAALVPQFATMTLRARMSTDVSTVKTAQGQIELYYQDMGSWPLENADVDNDDVTGIIGTLVSNNYLDSRYLASGGSSLLVQTSGANVIWVGGVHKLALKVDGSDLSKYNKQADIDQGWIQE